MLLSERAGFLNANNDAYEWLVRAIAGMDRARQREEVLRRIQMAAQFAVESHTGRFADGAIENIALQIGRELPSIVPEGDDFCLGLPARHNIRRVLHVTNRVFGIGGHTRMLIHWARHDQSSCHSVVLLDQGDVAVPAQLYEAVRSSGGSIAAFPPEALLCEKALWLRAMAQQSADLVVLHHFGLDVVPTVAFAAHDCPPVAVNNHADHLFWLGSSVADTIINARAAASKFNAERRFVSCNQVLPIPLTDEAKVMSRKDARKHLGIDEAQIVLLSVGRPEKYRPCGPYDFVATANKIIARNPHAHVYVVGETVSNIEQYLRCAIHERIHFVGSVDDPTAYRAAADIYLESFPFGSQTALLEAALGSLPVVPAYAPLFPLLVANDDALVDALPNPRDEQEYIDRAMSLVEEPELRATQGDVLRRRLLVDHVGHGWLRRLATIYDTTDHLAHSPRAIPVSSCIVENGDVSLSLWHVMAGRTFATDAANGEMNSVSLHIAFVRKTVGDHATAWRNALRILRRAPLRHSSWLLLILTLRGHARARLGRLRALAHDLSHDFRESPKATLVLDQRAIGIDQSL
jgi:hypothetical protein